MNYHDITKDDMLNGDGLRVVLWVSGCDHKCKNCQNPVTWDYQDGLRFDINAEKEIFEQLDKDYIDGITLSGGDPMNKNNLIDVLTLVGKIKSLYSDKTIWIYSGYTFEQIFDSNYDEDMEIRKSILSKCDVFVDGRFMEELKDAKYHWAGSTNQRVIDVQQSLLKGKVVTYDERGSN